MAKVFQAFTELQQYSGMPGEFSRKENDRKIGSLLKEMADNFHKLSDPKRQDFAGKDVRELLSLTSESLNDISRAFSAGKKDYALWRLQHVSSSCVSCHSRFEIKNDFISTEPEALSRLPQTEQGNYYLATRQFEKASSIYLEIAQSPVAAYDRLDAMRRWLIIEIRVHPEPQQTLATLQKFVNAAKLPITEDSEIRGWVESIEAWIDEPTSKVGTAEEAIKLARRLVGNTTETDDSLPDSDTFVDLLRASAVLHQHFASLSQSTHFAEALYLLGSIYSRMPHLFKSELPQIYLEQSIREKPDCENARKAYRRLEEIVLGDFTGSSGTHMPDDERLRLDQLKHLAEGTKPARSDL